MGRCRRCQYRYNVDICETKIGDIDISLISFTAALFGLVAYFIIARKVVNDVNVIPLLSFQTSTDVTTYPIAKWDT